MTPQILPLTSDKYLDSLSARTHLLGKYLEGLGLPRGHAYWKCLPQQCLRLCRRVLHTLLAPPADIPWEKTLRQGGQEATCQPHGSRAPWRLAAGILQRCLPSQGRSPCMAEGLKAEGLPPADLGPSQGRKV